MISNYTDWAWAAGFIDGEGSFGIWREDDSRKGKDYFSLRAGMQVSNTNLESLERLKKIFGGVGQIVKASKANPRHKAVFIYAVRRHLLLVEICFRILPYVTVKRGPIELVLAYCISRCHAATLGRGRRVPYSELEKEMGRKLSLINRRYPYAKRNY